MSRFADGHEGIGDKGFIGTLLVKKSKKRNDIVLSYYGGFGVF